MREILFRGKQIYDDGKWIIGHYACRYGTHYIYFPKTNPYSFDHEFIIPETVGQYTGLTDKNGTKIFEGDIIKAWGQRPMYVHFNEETLTWEMTDVGVPIFEVNHLLNTMDLAEVQVEAVVDEIHTEVIGNIHDNPELLKGETDNA